MATKIYDSKKLYLVDDTEIEATPLKLKYLREFMEIFDTLEYASSDEDSILILSYCALIAMKQYYPAIVTIGDLEDSLDLPTIYKVIDIAAGIKINEENKEETVKNQAQESGGSWKSLDLASLESEVFLLGIWKDYEDLELSLSMPELISTLSSKRDLEYQEKKFLAAIQGVDLDKNKNEDNAWEKMKARVFSGGGTSDPNDILTFRGQKAARSGLGLGNGLGYKKLDY
jgi:hypothetical protein